MTITLGTRDSELAMWQATTVQSQLEKLGHTVILKPVKSQGDLNLTEPLYEMGITGIFTKTLDVSLIKGDIDIAVHSLKDVPTQLPHGMVQAAVLARASHKDILVYKKSFDPDERMTIATGSLRRKSQWLNTFPNDTIVDLRGNVNTRLAKLKNNDNWNAAIFAKAGLERIGLLARLKGEYGFEHTNLDSFIPAPAQGVMMVAAMKNNPELLKVLSQLNDPVTEICVGMERLFLRELEGGCTAPIGALATVKENILTFKGCLSSLDGSKKLEFQEQLNLLAGMNKEACYAFAKAKSHKLLENGGKELMEDIREQTKISD